MGREGRQSKVPNPQASIRVKHDNDDDHNLRTRTPSHVSSFEISSFPLTVQRCVFEHMDFDFSGTKSKPYNKKMGDVAGVSVIEIDTALPQIHLNGGAIISFIYFSIIFLFFWVRASEYDHFFGENDWVFNPFPQLILWYTHHKYKHRILTRFCVLIKAQFQGVFLTFTAISKNNS